MALKSIPFADTSNSQELGFFIRSETRRVAVSLVYWLGALALIACPVWIPVALEWILGR